MRTALVLDACRRVVVVAKFNVGAYSRGLSDAE